MFGMWETKVAIAILTGQDSLWTGPTHFTGEWRGWDVVAGDGSGGKPHSFKLKHTAFL